MDTTKEALKTKIHNVSAPVLDLIHAITKI